MYCFISSQVCIYGVLAGEQVLAIYGPEDGKHQLLYCFWGWSRSRLDLSQAANGFVGKVDQPFCWTQTGYSSLDFIQEIDSLEFNLLKARLYLLVFICRQVDTDFRFPWNTCNSSTLSMAPKHAGWVSLVWKFNLFWPRAEKWRQRLVLGFLFCTIKV